MQILRLTYDHSFGRQKKFYWYDGGTSGNAVAIPEVDWDVEEIVLRLGPCRGRRRPAGSSHSTRRSAGPESR